MRTDQNGAGGDFSRSDAWRTDPFTSQPQAAQDERYSRGSVETNHGTRWHSFSGHEKDCLFLNEGFGRDQPNRFRDVSDGSGLDSEADGRSYVVWDFDRDGWTDIALVNANEPWLNLFRNQQGNHATNRSFLAVRLEGANHRPVADSSHSSRDGFGARVVLEMGEQRIVREHRCGEGFAAQNSSTLLIGLGNTQLVDRLTIHWPSGLEQVFHDIAVNQQVLIREPNESLGDVTGKGLITTAYRPASNLTGRQALPKTVPGLSDVRVWQTLSVPEQHEQSDVYLISTMATWCEACRRNKPRLAQIANRFRGVLSLYAVPIDPIESNELLSEYLSKENPPYELLPSPTTEQREELLRWIRLATLDEATPSSLLVTRDGRILAGFAGIPTASEVGRALLTIWQPQSDSTKELE